MVRVFVFLAAVQLVFVVLALISVLAAERVRAMPRALWVMVILLLPLIGPVLYAVAGRPVATIGQARSRPVARPAAPDDDPDFLKGLNPDRWRRDRELFENWERDLNRQTDETTRPDPARPDLTRPDLTRPDLTRPDPARPDLTRPDPARTDPARTDPARTDPARTDPAATESARTDETPPAEA